jgi:urea transport system permease protein
MITSFLVKSLDRTIVAAVAILLALAVIVPALNLLTAPEHPLHVPTYLVSLLGKYLTYALLALALDLVWGFCGILSLGHAAFFALGGYAMGMYLMRQIGARGSYGNPLLPDFMVFLNWKELPWFWYGFDMFWFAALMVVLVPGLLAFVFGWFAFRSRVNGVYLSIITQAMTYALLLAFFRNDMGFGGNNGLTDFKDILGFNIQADGNACGTLCSLRAGACRFARRHLGHRPARNSARCWWRCATRKAAHAFLGYRVEHMKLFAFTVSAMMAGVAGALYVPQVGIINPGEFAPANSIEVVIWTAVGGRGTLIGPIVGAILVNGGKKHLHRRLPRILALCARRALRPRHAFSCRRAWSARRRAISQAGAHPTRRPGRKARAKKRRALRTPKTVAAE